MESDHFNEIWLLLKNYLSLYGLKVIGAIAFLIIGLWMIKILISSVNKGISKRINNPSLVGFLKSFLAILLKVLLVVSIMSMIGIQMTSFIAILGAAGLAIGMALSGTLQNFAGGIMVLLFKPFSVGDFIQAMGHSGTVKEIQIFNTILNTADNRTIIIPNGKIYSESIINFSVEPQRRVDFTFDISYDNDIDKAKSIIQSIIDNNEMILKEPASFIGLIELADSSVKLVVRVWVESPNYWKVFFNINESVFKKFKEQAVNIPYPQMDIHLKTQN